MWKLLIDTEDVEDFYKLFPEQETETSYIKEAYTKLGEHFYHSKIPANLVYYKNLETNELHCKAYLLNDVLHEISEDLDLEALKKENHYLFVNFGIAKDKPYMRYANLPTFIEQI